MSTIILQGYINVSRAREYNRNASYISTWNDRITLYKSEDLPNTRSRLVKASLHYEDFQPIYTSESDIDKALKQVLQEFNRDTPQFQRFVSRFVEILNTALNK